MMPKIERSVAYTFDAYSGGLVEDTGRGKTPRFSQRNSQVSLLIKNVVNKKCFVSMNFVNPLFDFCYRIIATVCHQ